MFSAKKSLIRSRTFVLFSSFSFCHVSLAVTSMLLLIKVLLKKHPKSLFLKIMLKLSDDTNYDESTEIINLESNEKSVTINSNEVKNVENYGTTE